jgi:hypothetical protein
MMSLSLLAVAVCTCCWSMRRYCQHRAFVASDREAFVGLGRIVVLCRRSPTLHRIP